MNEIANRSTTPQKQYTSTDGYAGPVLADITCPTGIVYVSVDPHVEIATTRVLTHDGATSPAADAVRNTRISQNGERLVVVVPDVPQARGMASSSFMSVGGGTSWINGVRYDGPVTVVNGQVIGGASAANISTGVEVHITLPAGSAVRSRTEDGSLHAQGPIAAIDAEAVNGSIKVESVGRFKATAGNGSVTAVRVTEWIDASASNGSVRVDDYAGSACRVNAGNGSVQITVTPAASGRVEATAGNGSVKLYGVRGRTDLDVHAVAGNGTVKKL